MKTDAGNLDAGADPPIIDEHNVTRTDTLPDGASVSQRAGSVAARAATSPEAGSRASRTFSTVLSSLSLDELLGRILLSVVLAVLLWFYVTSLENPSQITTFRALTLDVRGIASNLKVISAPSTVDISFQAPQNVLGTLSRTNIHPYLDLDTLGAGVHDVPVSVDLSGNTGQNLISYKIDPPEVQVQLEVQATRQYTITINVTGTPAFGYGAEQAQVDPQQVTVTGSESAINRIASIAVAVDIGDKATTQRGFIAPTALDSAGTEITGLTFSPATVQVTVPIKLLLSNRLVPVRVPIEGNPAPGYSVDDIKIEPTNVTICCAPGNILESLESVSTQPVSISGTTSTVISRTALILPAGVELYPGQSSTVTVTIGVRTFDTTWQLSVSPTAQGLPPGYSVVLSPNTLNLTLEGTFAQFQALKPTDVTALVPVDNLAAGTYELAPQVTVPNDIKLVSVSPLTVTVSLIAPTPVPPTATEIPTSTPVPIATLTPTALVETIPSPELTPTASATATTTPTIVAPTPTLTETPSAASPTPEDTATPTATDTPALVPTDTPAPQAPATALPKAAP
jgi:YbbR domain-containing protein